MSAQPKDNFLGRVREADKALSFSGSGSAPKETAAAVPADIEFYKKPRATQMLVEDKLRGDQWTVKLDFSQPPGMKETVARKPGDENHNYWQHVWVLRIGDEEIQPSHFPDRAA